MPTRTTAANCTGCNTYPDHTHVTADAETDINKASFVEPKLKAKMNSGPGLRQTDRRSIEDRYRHAGDHVGANAIRDTSYVTDKLMRGEQLTDLERNRYSTAAFELWYRNRPF